MVSILHSYKRSKTFIKNCTWTTISFFIGFKEGVDFDILEVCFVFKLICAMLFTNTAFVKLLKSGPSLSYCPL